MRHKTILKDKKKELSTKKQNFDPYLIEKIQPQGGISFTHDHFIRTGGGYSTCIHIYEFPTTLSDHWLSYLCNIKDTITTVDISTEDVTEIKKNLNRSIKEQDVRYQEAKNFSEEYDATQRIREMQSLYDEISSMGEVIKVLAIRIFLSDRSLAGLEERTKEIMTQLESDSFLPTVFLNEMHSEYLSMFSPYQIQQQEKFAVYGQPLQSMALAGGNPFHFSSLEDPNGDVLGVTPCGGNVIFDEFRKTDTRLSYNGLAVGIMGSGKSTLLKKRFLGRAVRGDFVRAFDISGEFARLTRYLGGKIIKTDGTDGILNPLEILRSGETEGQSYMRHISKVSTIYRFLASATGNEVPDEIYDFKNLLQELYESLGLAGAEGKQITGLPAEMYPTFSDFYGFIEKKMSALMEEEGNNKKDDLIRAELSRLDKIRRVLRDIISNYGAVFDGHTSISNISDEQIVTFDMSILKDVEESVFDAQIFNMVSFCWDNCVTNGKIMKERYENHEIPWEDIVRFLIIIDESHRWINAEKPAALSQILVYMREARKFFGGILLASQSIRDFVPEGSGQENINKLKTLFELAQYKFIFNQDSNAMPLFDQVFANILTSSQKSRIPKLMKGENILCISSDTNIEFRVSLSEEEDELFSGGA